MASTTFSQGTVIQPAWLNAVNLKAYVESLDIKADPYSAVGNGIADDLTPWRDAINTGKVVILPPGEYYLGDYFRPTSGQDIFLIGVNRDLVTVRCAPSRIPIYSDAAVGTDVRVGNVYISGITFDGGHVRTPSSYPYGSDPGSSMTQALNLRSTKGADTKFCVIRDCRFKNINGLPVWIADFDGGVEFSGNHLYKVKDPGFLYNDNVRIFNNVIEFSADNGVSVSRGNKHVLVYGNTIRDCASSGIFVGGVRLTGSGSVTLSGASYTAGSTINITTTANLTTEDLGINIIARSGASRALVRITQITSSTTAVGTAMIAVPAALQNVATSDWSRQVSGAQSGAVCFNTIEGASNYGIHSSGGSKDLAVFSNTIRRTGITRDSETYTTLSTGAASGGTTLQVTNGAAFANGDWILLDVDYTMDNYFAVQIASGGGTNTLTLATALPQTYATGTLVYRAYRRTAAYGILAIGAYESASILEFAEGFKIYDNIIVDSVTGGIRLGSTSGAIRDSQIHNNQIFLRQTNHVESTVYGILIGDVDTTMRTVRLDVWDNTISLDGTSGSYGIYYKPIDNNVNSYIRIGENKFRLCNTNTIVVEQTGSTNITTDYMPQDISGALPTYDVVGVDALGLSTWVPATHNAGTLTVTQSLNSYAPSGVVNITDLAMSGITHATPLLVIRNSATGAGDDIVFTHNVNKLRLQGGVNKTINAYESITFVPISPTIYQQIA